MTSDKDINQPPHQNERRSFFRVEQNTLLNYETVTPEFVATQAPYGLNIDSQLHQLLSDIRQHDQQAKALLARIGEKDSDMGSFLQLQDNKLNLLLNWLISHQGNTADDIQNIDISEGGLSFNSSETLNIGRLLNLELFFLASNNTVLSFAQVLRCDKTSEGYRISLRFKNISDDQQSQIAKEVIQTQLAQKRAKL